MLSHWRKLLRFATVHMPRTFIVDISSIQQKVSNVDLRGVYLIYDKITGLDQVRLAHEEVMRAERVFIDRQLDRRACQNECFRLEEARNRLNIQLDSVSRSDESFLTLVTQLHELSRQHKEAREKLSGIETAEQLAFEHFSGCLRRSQAEERVQASRMRQWSIGLSVIAGLVGFSATWLRFRQQASLHPVSTVAVAAADRESLYPIMNELQNTNEQLKETMTSLSTLLEGLRTNSSKDENVVCSPETVSRNPIESVTFGDREVPVWALITFGTAAVSVLTWGFIFGHSGGS